MIGQYLDYKHKPESFEYKNIECIKSHGAQNKLLLLKKLLQILIVFAGVKILNCFKNCHFCYVHVFVPGNYTLRINLEDFDGNQRYAEYKNFRVTDEKVTMLGDR